MSAVENSAASPTIRLYGVRHHGPGCARALMQALQQQAPDILLVEGPPEANALVELAADPQMSPPVALLVYALEDSTQASFYPFASFSPEWQALQYANRQAIPLRFFDLPASVRLAAALQKEVDGVPASTSSTSSTSSTPSSAPATEPDVPELGVPDVAPIWQDPLDHFARLSGFADGESWWDALIEQRQHGAELFDIVLQAMRDLRAATPPPQAAEQLIEMQREAAMRQQMRAALKEGFVNIAVVCGAWHTSALEHLPPAKQDAALLKDLPKCKVAATWIPWNYQRLAMSSGYGAGITSPGWYEFLWQQKHNQQHDLADKLAERWLTHVAHLLRQQDLVASSAEVIDAVRLAQMLAHINGRGTPGLEEFNQAASSALCMGEAAPLALIQRELIVGTRLGQVPETTPAAPIARDLAALQKSLRLKPSAIEEDLELDLRQANDLAKSHLLHRLSLLEIGWGKAQKVYGKRGSFHEHWRLLWEPEMALHVIEAGRYGQTVLAAAQNKVLEQLLQMPDLPKLTKLLQQVLLADLPEVLPALLQRLADMAAQSADILHLLDALPPLAASLRYGSVRQLERGQIGQIVTAILARIAIGLPNACLSIKREAAQELLQRMAALQLALKTEQDPDLDEVWQACLKQIAQLQGAHPLLLGRCHRILLDAQVLDADSMAQRLALALSHPEPEYAADWIEGMLAGSGLLLVTDDRLWHLLDDWLQQLSAAEFVRSLPLLRRAFARFPANERQMLGQRASQGEAGATTKHEMALEMARVMKILPLARQLLGGHARSGKTSS